MSTREELFEGLTDGGWNPAPGEAESANALLDAYRDDVRTEVLTEAAAALGRIADTVEARVAEHYGAASGIGPGSADMLREAGRSVLDMAGKGTSDGSQPPAGEPIQPAPVQVWLVFEEDTHPAVPPVFTTKTAAEQGTIDRYQAGGEYSPDYSWRPHEDGAHELLAGGDPVGIYLTPVTVSGDTAGLSAPGFFQPGRTYVDGDGYRAPETLTLFRVETVATHPSRGTLRAIGWAKIGAAPGGTWHGYFLDEGEFAGWTEYAEGEAGRD